MTANRLPGYRNRALLAATTVLAALALGIFVPSGGELEHASAAAPPANCTRSISLGDDPVYWWWSKECRSLQDQGSYANYYTFTVSAQQAPADAYITVESCARPQLFLWQGTTVDRYDADRKVTPGLVAYNGAWSGGSHTNWRAIARIERARFEYNGFAVVNNVVRTDIRQTYVDDLRLTAGTYTIEVRDSYWTRSTGFRLRLNTDSSGAPDANYCSTIETGLYPQSVSGDRLPPTPPTKSTPYWLDQDGVPFTAAEYDYGATGVSGPSGPSNYQGPVARNATGCFTEMGPLISDQFWGGEWEWDPTIRVRVGSFSFRPDQLCRSHHRAERPARYFRFTLDQASSVTLDLVALEANASAKLYVSNDTPRNAWGTPPGNSYANRVSTRLSKGKLIHDASPEAALLLPAGTYTAEAVADSFSADSFTLRINVKPAPDAVTTPDADTAPTVTDTSKFKNHYATVGQAFSLVLPAADANSGNGGPYTYQVLNRADGTAFSANGLSFDATTRTLSGTPTAEDSHELTYRIHDADDNRADSDAFVDKTLKIVVAPDGNAEGDGQPQQSAPQQSNSEPEPPAEPEPSPPTANAGADFNGKRGEALTLSGSGTSHANGSQTLTYQWRVSDASDDELVTVGATFLSNADQAQAGFTVMKRKHMTDRSTLDDGNWIEFTLTVTDGDGESHSDTVQVTIQGTTWKKGQ